MKTFLKEKIIEPILKWMALSMLQKHKPEIIGITGSFGKTSTKDAIALVLKSRFDVLSSPRSYNTKIGGPLTIFNQEVPAKVSSVFGWLKIIFSSFWQLLFKRHYPKILVMELGIDQPGEMAYYLSFLKPKIGIVTAVGQAHIEGLKDIKTVAYEKGLLVECLGKGDYAFLNYDDENVRAMRKRTKAKILTFGTNKKADLWANNIKSEISGLSFDLHFKGKTASIVRLPIIGEHFIYSLLPAVLSGIIYKMDLDEITKVLTSWRPPKGRMNIIPGLKNSLIIDDSYNANPSSMLIALDILNKFEGRKIAALGTMNELGGLEEKGHREVGKKVASIANLLITVGEPARRYLASEANKNGLPSSSIFCFKNSKQAGKFLKDKIEQGDIILAKGSQNNVRMEHLVQEIMAEPEKAKDLLVRQGEEWETRS